jgi:hypothetical protein
VNKSHEVGEEERMRRRWRLSTVEVETGSGD